MDIKASKVRLWPGRSPGRYACRVDGTLSQPRGISHRNLSAGPPVQCAPPHFVRADVKVHQYPDAGLAVFHGRRCLGRYDSKGVPIGDPSRLQAAPPNDASAGDHHGSQLSMVACPRNQVFQSINSIQPRTSTPQAAPSCPSHIATRCYQYGRGQSGRPRRGLPPPERTQACRADRHANTPPYPPPPTLGPCRDRAR
jgi:hypothetical protein